MKRYSLGDEGMVGTPTGSYVLHSDLSARVLPVLRAVEWHGEMDGSDCCPKCYHPKHVGHAPDCTLAALIAELSAP